MLPTDKFFWAFFPNVSHGLYVRFNFILFKILFINSFNTTAKCLQHTKYLMIWVSATIHRTNKTIDYASWNCCTLPHQHHFSNKQHRRGSSLCQSKSCITLCVKLKYSEINRKLDMFLCVCSCIYIYSKVNQTIYYLSLSSGHKINNIVLISYWRRKCNVWNKKRILIV